MGEEILELFYGGGRTSKRALLAAVIATFGVTQALSVAGADAKGEALLKQSKSAYKNAQAITGTLAIHSVQNGRIVDASGPVRMKKPKLGFLKLRAPVNETYASDGKSVYVVLPTNEYVKTSVADGGISNLASLSMQMGLFYGVEKGSFVDLTNLRPNYVGKESVKGVSYDVLKTSGTKPFSFSMKLYVDPSNHLITRTVLDAELQGNKLVQTVEIQNLVLNPALTTGSFAVALPKNAKPYVQAKPEADPYEAKLVAVGKPAPTFSLPNPKGGSVSLAEALRGNKAVLVNFWFYG